MKPPVGFERFNPWYAALRTGAAFNPLALPDLLAYYDIRRTDTLFQDSAGTTPVAVATDPIGRWNAVGPSGAPNLTQGTAPSRPLYQLTPTRAEFDLLDDSISVTLPAISGGQIVIVSPAGIWIDSLTFAGGTFTIGPSTYTGGPAGLLSLLSGDVTAVYILDAPLSPGDQAAVVSFETARGSAGLIELGVERFSDPDLDAPLAWDFGGGLISGGVATILSDAGSNALIELGITESGKTYLAELALVSKTGGNLRISPSSGTGYAAGALEVPNVVSSTGVYRGFTTPTGESMAGQVILAWAAGQSAVVSRVSLREVILP